VSDVKLYLNHKPFWLQQRPQKTRPAPATGKLNLNKSQTALLILY